MINNNDRYQCYTLLVYKKELQYPKAEKVVHAIY